MTITQPPPAVRTGKPAEAPRVDPVVEPRWIRSRRREAARTTARREALVDRILRHVAANPAAGREKTIDEILDEQGIGPVDWARARRESGLTRKDWAELRAALEEARGR